jgi:nucleotide-binding universal stress UspA family protein
MHMATGDTEGSLRENRDPHGADDRISFRSILVPIDFSEHSTTTVTYAAKVAEYFGCQVRLLHVINLQDNPIHQYPLEYKLPDRYVSQFEYAESEAKNALKAFEDTFSSRGISVTIETRVGSPFEEILTAADLYDADLIVIGSYGGAGIGRQLLGTAERVAGRARCSVLIVKGR